MKTLSRNDLHLQALEDKLARLKKKLDAAEKAYQERNDALGDTLALDREFWSVHKSEIPPKEKVAKMDVIMAKKEKLEKIMKKDWLKLMDRVASMIK